MGLTMTKPSSRPLSRYAVDAVTLLGSMIRKARIDRGITVAELAERAGTSRGLVQRLERGDPGCAIGTAFEIATILGIPLFDSDAQALKRHLGLMQQTLAVLPQSVRPSGKAVKDDF